MTAYLVRPLVLLLATTFSVACNSQGSGTDQRVAELERQLAETQSQLATANPQTAPAEPALSPAAPGAAPASDGSAAEVQRLADQQKAVNAEQADANLRLQRQVDQMKPRELSLPDGTIIPVRTTTQLSSAGVSNGSAFDALLEHDLTSGGTLLAKAGTRVTGFVISSDPGGRVKGTASLTVGVRSVVGVKGQVIALTTDSYEVDAASTKKRDAVRTGVATGVGALIGGIAGGGKGAAIGAGVGVGAGVGANAATRGAPAVIPAEELIEFRLISPVTVVMQP